MEVPRRRTRSLGEQLDHRRELVVGGAAQQADRRDGGQYDQRQQQRVLDQAGPPLDCRHRSLIDHESNIGGQRPASA